MNIVNDEYNNLKLKFYNIESESKKKQAKMILEELERTKGEVPLQTVDFSKKYALQSSNVMPT
jgi:hypothetical protein